MVSEADVLNQSAQVGNHPTSSRIISSLGIRTTEENWLPDSGPGQERICRTPVATRADCTCNPIRLRLASSIGPTCDMTRGGTAGRQRRCVLLFRFSRAVQHEAQVRCSKTKTRWSRPKSCRSRDHQNNLIHAAPPKCGQVLPQFGGRIPVRRWKWNGGYYTVSSV